ncbi:MAG: tRNA (adenosine(37)-N6)-dimethylallyltransferase MiaA [Tannerella sp.]|jgi:tRNA dimethylallyltransferase|nr:tRNA (adenosine(37)-N6)-dimethylallyltransferase MiaA [Tannerella sp.]
MEEACQIITVLGPTASGKTAFAVALAGKLDSEIISADSRQVYRSMDIGTGKDLGDYRVNGQTVPYHLIDICEPGERYNVFAYQHDFFRVYEQIRAKGKLPVLCGGSGLYIEAVLKGYRLWDVPPDHTLRDTLKDKSLPELEKMLASYRKLHNTTDTDTPQRAIRAIEIAEYNRRRPAGQNEYAPLHSLIIGTDISREHRRENISRRLRSRLDEGMVDEVRHLLNRGLSPEDLIYYGLEYKYITLFVTGKLTYDEMTTQLEIAIHQFAKRQMTWFRGMERRGFTIHWIDALLPLAEKVELTLNLLHNKIDKDDNT